MHRQSIFLGWDASSKAKSAVPIKFWRNLTAFERRTEEWLEMLFSDGGGKYISKQFEGFFCTRGTQHIVTNTYTFQQNKIAWRGNYTLLYMVRSLHKTKRAWKEFCGDAVVTPAIIQNWNFAFCALTVENVSPYSVQNRYMCQTSRYSRINHFVQSLIGEAQNAG